MDLFECIKLIKKLDEGASGEVYLAEVVKPLPYAKTKDLLAVKVFKIHFTKEYEKKRRLRISKEFETLEFFDHPNLVKGFESGRRVVDGQDQYYIVMEFLSGDNLLRWRRRRDTISLDTWFDLAYQLFEAVNHIHEHGYQHRDIKPTNIIITDEKCLKLLDFGVIEDLKETIHTSENVTVGTLRYMPAEYLFGNSTVNIDTFGIAAVLSYLLTGLEIYSEVTRWPELVKIASEKAAFNAEAVERSLPLNERGAFVFRILQEMLHQSQHSDKNLRPAVCVCFERFNLGLDSAWWNQIRLKCSNELTDAALESFVSSRELPSDIRVSADEFRELGWSFTANISNLLWKEISETSKYHLIIYDVLPYEEIERIINSNGGRSWILDQVNSTDPGGKFVLEFARASTEKIRLLKVLEFQGSMHDLFDTHYSLVAIATHDGQLELADEINDITENIMGTWGVGLERIGKVFDLLDEDGQSYFRRTLSKGDFNELKAH